MDWRCASDGFAVPKNRTKSTLHRRIYEKIQKTVFTFDSKLYLPDGISDDLYYCIYDFGHKKFITVDEDVFLFGWHRATFIYDKENSRYYCSDMAI